MAENLRDWVVEEPLVQAESGKRKKLYKSPHNPKQQPTYSTFTKNVPSEVPSELKPARKPRIPKPSDAPRHGLQSDKNFVLKNAVQAIVGAQHFRDKLGKNKPSNQIERYVNKKDYGQNPKYLNKVKEQIALESELLREYMDEVKLYEGGGAIVDSMPEADRKKLINDLKRKWGAINRAYQKTSCGGESISKNRLRERYEREMREIENDISLLSRGHVKVLDN